MESPSPIRNLFRMQILSNEFCSDKLPSVSLRPNLGTEVHAFSIMTSIS